MIRRGIFILVLMLCLLRPASGASLSCGKDLDGDGKVTGQGETAQCVGDNGTLCPIDVRNCTTVTADPICPPGGSFVPADDRCEAPAPVTCSLTGQSYATGQSCVAACSPTAPCSVNDVGLLNAAGNEDYATAMTANGGSFDFYGYNYDTGGLGLTGSISLSGFSASGGLVSSVGYLKSVTAAGDVLWVSGYDDNWNWYTTPIYLSGATASGSWSSQACGAAEVVGSGNSLLFYEHTGDCYYWGGQAVTGSISFQGTSSCPYGSQYPCDGGSCSGTGTCSPGDCPPGYTWDGNLCTISPQCAKGTYSDADKQCHDASTYTCPYGDTIACVPNNGVMQCSPTACFDPQAPGNQIIQNNDSSMLQNDGQRDNLGNCLGDLYIFSGRSMECKTSGQESGWKNCCMSGSAPLADDLGSASSMMSTFSTITNVYHMGQIAYYGNMVSGLGDYGVQMIGSFNVSPEVSSALTAVAQTGDIAEGLMTYAEAAFLNPTTLALAAAMYLVQDFLLSGSCSQDDIQTAMLDDSGMCHYIDTYCKKKWPLAGCVQEAKVFCCFNSKLARIVQEQGRPQLSTFNPPWAYAGSGNCRGFTPSEFQMLDFSKMDLSEYLGDIKAKAQATLQNTINDKINQYYQKTQP